MPDHPNGAFNDPEMHRLFQALREHVVEVADDFSRRVLFRVQALIEERQGGGPTLSEIVEDTTLEAVNVVTRGIQAGLRHPEGDDAPDATERGAQAEETEDE